jgi:hypothetical protein
MAYIDGNFKTSGALISHKHVVSILSAVGDWDKKYIPPASPERIKVYLGVLNPEDEYANPIRASKVIFHPDYKFADNLPVINIAIIELSTSVEFTEYVRPVCLSSVTHGMNLMENSPIYAVGYGRNEKGELTNARKYARMTTVSKSACKAQFDGQQNFMKESSTFCVKGSKDGSPCHQDESLFVKYNGKWYWKGFSVIRFYLTSNPNTCSISPVLYEDSAQYTEWIRSQIENYS